MAWQIKGRLGLGTAWAVTDPSVVNIAFKQFILYTRCALPSTISEIWQTTFWHKRQQSCSICFFETLFNPVVDIQLTPV